MLEILDYNPLFDKNTEDERTPLCEPGIYDSVQCNMIETTVVYLFWYLGDRTEEAETTIGIFPFKVFTSSTIFNRAYIIETINFCLNAFLFFLADFIRNHLQLYIEPVNSRKQLLK